MKLLKSLRGDGSFSRYLGILFVAIFMLTAGTVARSAVFFNGPNLYKQAFDHISSEHIGLLEMSHSDRQAWLAEWKDKFNNTNVFDTENGTDKAIQDMLSSLKFKHDSYWKPNEWSKRSADRRAQFGGIGVSLQVEGAERVTDAHPMKIFSEPREHSPAWKAGLLKGDIVLSVNRKSLHGKTADDAVSRIRGQVGTLVYLNIKRKLANGHFYIFNQSIVRGVIPIDMVESKSLGDGVYHVKINSFSFDRFEKDVSAALKRAASHKALVLNLRGNPGGDRDMALKLLEWLVPEGVIYVQTSREGDVLMTDTTSLTATQVVTVRTWSDNRTSSTFSRPREKLLIPARMPLIALMDGSSASASEITLGGLKGTGRASLLIGIRSYGKGHGQNVWNLLYGRGIFLVNFRFKPGNITMDGIGIDPDVVDNTIELEKYLEFAKQKALGILALP